jgi:beta-lactamase regulating signal transducer with metallopeptidase domain
MNLWTSSSLPKEVTTFALLVAISGVAASTLALLAGRLLHRRSAAARHGVLFGGVLGLLAAPALVAVGQSQNGLFAVTTQETVKLQADQLPDVLGQPTAKDPPAPARLSFEARELVGGGLVAVWVLGVAFGLAGLVRALWRQRRALAGEPWQPTWWTDERRRALAEKVGLRQFPPVWRSPLAPMPMVVGLCRPRIVLPHSAPWGQAQWEAVLLHEAAHIVRRDPLAALATRLAVIHFWWCPLVYLLARRLGELREGICDGYALEGPCDRFAYAQLLVETAERIVHLKTVAVGLLNSARGGLETRITRLLAKEKRPMTRLTLAGKLLGAAALLLAGLTIMAATAYSQAPAPQKKIQIKIVIDGKELDLTDEVIQMLLAKRREEALWKNDLNITRALELANATDPAIENLIRQAEKLRPGSGAAVRKALQQAQDQSDLTRRKAAIKLPLGQPVPPPVALALYPYPHQAGEFLKDYRIAVATEPGDILFVEIKADADTLKRLEKSGLKIISGPMVPRDVQPIPPGPEEITLKIKSLRAAGKLQEAAALEKYGTAVQAMTRWAVKHRQEATTPKQPPAKTPDLEALSRQLERLQEELRELRMRLDRPNPQIPAIPKTPSP